MNKESLVYSEEENLLAQSQQQIRDKHNLQTIKVQKFQRRNDQDEDDCLRKYLVGESQTQGKSFKKIDKEKQKFLRYDNRIQKIALKEATVRQKMSELQVLIQMERLNKYQLKIIELGKFLSQFAEDLINQKKSIQKQYEELVEFNQIAIMKLNDINKFFQTIQPNSSSSSFCPNCDVEFSFSRKRQSGLREEERFEFAKTIIGTLQEFELKKVEQEQRYSESQMNFVELLLHLKNKAEGGNCRISSGLVDRLCSGATLKQWIRIVDQKLSSVEIKQFVEEEDFSRKKLFLDQFIGIIKKNSEKLIKKILQSSNPSRENQFIRYSTMQTFMNILTGEKKQLTKEIAFSYFGDLNRQLTIIEKKSGVEQNQQHASSTKQVIQYMQRLFERY